MSPAPHQLPQDSGSPGRSSPAMQTPVPGAGERAPQSWGGVLSSGEGDAPPSDPCSPSKSQSCAADPIWDGHHITWLLPASSILPLWLKPHAKVRPSRPMAGLVLLLGEKKPPARTKDLLHLAEAAGWYTSPAPRWHRGNAQPSPPPAGSGLSVSPEQTREKRRDQDVQGFTAPGGSWCGEHRPHPRTQGRHLEPAPPKRLRGQPGTRGCSST